MPGFSPFRFLRRLFGRPAPKPTRQKPITAVEAAQTTVQEQQPAPLAIKVSLIIFNPRIPTRGNQKLTEVLGWNDPDELVRDFAHELYEISRGYAQYQVVERIEVDSFPVKADGFRYRAQEYVYLWQAGGPFHLPDAINYDQILADYHITEKVSQGQIDEVWTVSYPWAGFYESCMAGPGAFWCNAPPLDGTNQAGRRFIIMAFNYERGVGEMLESYGHRAESILERVFKEVPAQENLWKRFTRHEKSHPGRAEVGSIHYAPNSRSDYDWGNRQPVLSRFYTWERFPDLRGEPVLVDSRAWGQGDTRVHHQWWFRLLPHAPGQTRGISNNWWEYVVDPNRAP